MMRAVLCEEQMPCLIYAKGHVASSMQENGTSIRIVEASRRFQMEQIREFAQRTEEA